ncbi:type II toxin-antitoxin system RelE/ParE family toxin [Occultella kanbiaonis]|uniref:type II toxin-antitoxin system RelE/ParE family toxin n=1 Tax=Occultella kanbiaonis TaxID=2675754 RepID=UPI0013D33007
MTHRVRLTRSAERDRNRAIAWYDAEAPDQTERFIDDFYVAARRLEEFPHSGPVVRSGARRVSLRLFPYQLWYRVHDEAKVVEIIAVLHHRQDPERLNDRLSRQPGE